MSESLVLYEQLLSALYNAAAVLVAAVTDPVAIEQAPLKHRASALNAVSSLFSRLQKLSPAPASDTYQDIEFVFDSPDEEDDLTAGAPAFETDEIMREMPITTAPAPVMSASIPSEYAPYHRDAANSVPPHADPWASAHYADYPPVSAPRRVEAMSSLLDYDRFPA